MFVALHSIHTTFTRLSTAVDRDATLLPTASLRLIKFASAETSFAFSIDEYVAVCFKKLNIKDRLVPAFVFASDEEMAKEEEQQLNRMHDLVPQKYFNLTTAIALLMLVCEDARYVLSNDNGLLKKLGLQPIGQNQFKQIIEILEFEFSNMVKSEQNASFDSFVTTAHNLLVHGACVDDNCKCKI